MKPRWQFSLKSLLIAVTLFFLSLPLLALLGLVPPQVAILILATVPAPALTTLVLIRRRFHKPRARSLVFASIAAWLAVYVASIGPAAGFLMWANMENNRTAHAYFGGLYAPVILAFTSTTLSEPIEWYVDYWQQLALRLR